MTEEGLMHLKLMTQSNWKEEINKEILKGYDCNIRTTTVACDAKGEDGESYILNYCIPDIVKLKNFIEASKLSQSKKEFIIYCFEHQVSFIESLEGNVTIYYCKIEDYCYNSTND